MVGQHPFDLTITNKNNTKINFESYENHYCYLMNIENKTLNEECKVFIKYEESDENDENKITNHKIEIIEFKKNDLNTKEIEFSCVKENNAEIIIEGNCELIISGVFCEPGTSDEEDN